MSIKDGILKIERKWAWSFSGFLLAIIFGGIAVYTSFFQDKNPNLQFIVESNTTVLDLKEDVKDLEILYKGVDIKKQEKNLSLIKLKVVNNSNVNILKGSYDDLSPLRVLVSDAEIVDKPQIITTSNNYLKENLNLSVDTTGCIKLPPLIIEGYEYYEISLLILHKNENKPEIVSAGKIAGQVDGIDVLSEYQTAKEKDFWAKLIYGNVWIHIIRFFGYFGFLIVCVSAVVLPIFLISESISDLKKKKRIKKYKSRKKLENTPETDAVFDIYLEYSLEIMILSQKLLMDEEVLRTKFQEILKREKNKDKIKSESDFVENDFLLEEEVIRNEHIRERYRRTDLAARILWNSEMVKLKDGKLTVNEIFKKELFDFISYLKLI